MVSINVPNFITVGLMGLIFAVGLKFALGATVGKPDWL